MRCPPSARPQALWWKTVAPGIATASRESALHRTPKALGYLKDENNVRLNRAAYALGRLGDKTVRSRLIDVLVTTHYIVLPSKSDAYTAVQFGETASSVAARTTGGPVVRVCVDSNGALSGEPEIATSSGTSYGCSVL